MEFNEGNLMKNNYIGIKQAKQPLTRKIECLDWQVDKLERVPIHNGPVPILTLLEPMAFNPRYARPRIQPRPISILRVN